MTFSFNDEAEQELLEAVDYFETRSEGLGLDLSREFFASIQKIVASPEGWPSIGNGLRRHLTDRFPYTIIYEIADGEIFIWAVMHQSRKPSYWTSRLDP